MADLLALSSRIIDAGADPDQGPALINRITHELSEIDTGIAVVEAFSHSVVFRTDDGLVVFDTRADSDLAPCISPVWHL